MLAFVTEQIVTITLITKPCSHLGCLIIQRRGIEKYDSSWGHRIYAYVYWWIHKVRNKRLLNFKEFPE